MTEETFRVMMREFEIIHLKSAQLLATLKAMNSEAEAFRLEMQVRQLERQQRDPANRAKTETASGLGDPLDA